MNIYRQYCSKFEKIEKLVLYLCNSHWWTSTIWVWRLKEMLAHGKSVLSVEASAWGKVYSSCRGLLSRSEDGESQRSLSSNVLSCDIIWQNRHHLGHHATQWCTVRPVMCDNSGQCCWFAIISCYSNCFNILGLDFSVCRRYINMEGNEVLESPCLVCKATTRTGLHYGAITCYPCRAFFRL